MEISLTSLKSNFAIPIGALSQKRVEAVQRIVGAEYPVIQNVPVGNTLIFVNNSTKSLVVIGQNQVSFSEDGLLLNDFNPIIEKWARIVSEITKAFMLDEVYLGHEIDIQGVVGLYNGGKKAALNLAINKFSPIAKQQLKKITDEILAIGLRYVFKKNNFVIDSRIEPFAMDHSKVFLSLNAKVAPGNYPFENIKTDIEYIDNFFRTTWFNYIKELII